MESHTPHEPGESRTYQALLLRQRASPPIQQTWVRSLRRSHSKDDDGPPPRRKEEPDDAGDEEAPETPLDEPAPMPIQDPPAEPDPHPYTVSASIA